MNPFASKNDDDNKVNPRNILGGILGGFDEIGFEMEVPSVSSVVKGAGEVVEDFLSLGKDITGVEEKSSAETQKFPPQGTIEFNQKVKEMEDDRKLKEESQAKKVFYQAIKEDSQRAEQAKNRMLFEEEMNDIITNLPTEQKNELLHYQASYKDRSIYQRAELRKKLIEQRKEEDKKQKEVSMAQTAPKASALNAAMEGGSGTQGGGQANLSFQAAG